MQIKTVDVIGKGAVGLLFGSRLAAHLGEGAVSFLMDDARYERYQSRTFLINGEPCTIPDVPASAARPVDLIVVATKAPGLELALESMAGAVGADTRIISLINGIRSEERIAERYGWGNTVLAIAQGMDAFFSEGSLTFSHPGEIRLGASPQTLPEAVSDIAQAFTCAGVRCIVEDDIEHRLWTKLMLNVGINQTCMAYAGTYGSVCEESGEQFRSFVAAMREVIAVAAAEGVHVGEDDLNAMIALVRTLDPAGMPSMAQDRLNEKPTEVEEFSGTIIELAERHGIQVPQNRFLYRRIREIEAGW